jgi:hypothetical protein
LRQSLNKILFSSRTSRGAVLICCTLDLAEIISVVAIMY